MQLHPISAGVRLQWLSLLTQRLVIEVPVRIVVMQLRSRTSIVLVSGPTCARCGINCTDGWHTLGRPTVSCQGSVHDLSHLFAMFPSLLCCVRAWEQQCQPSTHGASPRIASASAADCSLKLRGSGRRSARSAGGGRPPCGGLPQPRPGRCASAPLCAYLAVELMTCHCMKFLTVSTGSATPMA